MPMPLPLLTWVLVCVAAQVKLADFGVALKLSDSKQSDLDVVGSPYWMAPEIIEMNGELGSRLGLGLWWGGDRTKTGQGSF